MLKLFKRKPKQTTFCYCTCGIELCSSHVNCYEDNDGLIHFKCKCGVKTTWLFDTPTPILLTNV